MPERKGLRTFETSDVQGEDSWIKLRSMTLGELMDLQREAEDRRGFWYRLGRFFGRRFRKPPSPVETARRNMAQIIGYVRAWNWVNDQGQLLPLPANDPSVLDQLTMDEMQVITDCVNGARESEEQKN
jgi:hypothetical protein